MQGSGSVATFIWSVLKLHSAEVVVHSIACIQLALSGHVRELLELVAVSRLMHVALLWSKVKSTPTLSFYVITTIEHFGLKHVTGWYLNLLRSVIYRCDRSWTGLRVGSCCFLQRLRHCFRWTYHIGIATLLSFGSQSLAVRHHSWVLLLLHVFAHNVVYSSLSIYILLSL